MHMRLLVVLALTACAGEAPDDEPIAPEQVRRTTVDAVCELTDVPYGVEGWLAIAYDVPTDALVVVTSCRQEDPHVPVLCQEHDFHRVIGKEFDGLEWVETPLVMISCTEEWEGYVYTVSWI